MIALLITHIMIALGSVMWASIVAVRPSFKKLYVSYGLIGATLSTGTVLVILSSRPLLSGCLVGLVYAAGMTIVTIVAHVRIKVMALERASQE